jgi:hypothetical protein
MVTFAGTVKAGAILSMIVNVADVELALPQASVAKKVAVPVPVAPHPSERPPKEYVHVTAPQLSVADAPPCVLRKVVKAVVLPDPSH